MIKLYRKSQAVQYAWIRNHPIQYVVLNATLIVVAIGYIAYKERKETRELNHEIANQKN